MAVFDTIVASWNLESNSNDNKNSHNWTDTAISYVAGKIWNGASLNGTSSFIEIPDSVDLRYQTWWVNWNLSISLWYKPTNTTGVQTLIWKWANGSASTDWIIYQNWVTITGAILWWANQAATWSVLSAGTWCHIVMTIDSSKNIAVYINGSSSATATNSTSPTYWTYDPVRIGQNSSTNWMNWVVDLVQIFSSELASWDVTTLYNGWSWLAYPLYTWNSNFFMFF